MRALAIAICMVLLPLGAAAQDRGKGGPHPDPLGDRTYPQADKPEPAPRRAEPVRVKSKVKRRTVHRSQGTVVTKQPSPPAKVVKKK